MLTLGSGAVSALPIAHALGISDWTAKVIVHVAFDAVLTFVEEQLLKAKKKKRAQKILSRSSTIDSSYPITVRTRSTSCSSTATTSAWAEGRGRARIFKARARWVKARASDDDETLRGSGDGCYTTCRPDTSYASTVKKKVWKKTVEVMVIATLLAVKYCPTKLTTIPSDVDV